ncbi:acetoin utilization deacetylase AcuC-like enzyme [Allocatelliglobosispora scoriae]|uniref:Acetoin utilization deacetylase AcuC-like enzyme n=1 Tax=Allocatelliglobosispora scoriae TaxID=643052 RepID=A0A841BPH3_9ACTN|nr:histone deacetylase family protein [Allocatelliglobosispora scoriae]MBB5870174.1 acetoin utilization deacetylase AcuC-like enzyme [Allocatelliglobosispora scoriae]
MTRLDLPVVWSDEVLRHEPGAEIWVGVSTPGTEVPERATVIRDAVVAAGATLVPAVASRGASLLAEVHTPELLTHLESVYDEWVAAGFLDYPGQDRVVPYVFPTPAMLDGLPARRPTAIHARAGAFCYDTMTLIGPDTWAAARAAADAAATAADLAAAGTPVTYAITRPPGHHATPGGYGGSCYLNNAAVAVAGLRAAGARRVAIIDIDAHHGNGTQAIFYSSAEVRYASVHVDPGAGWFPHYAGFADETGVGAGAGANLNLPLDPGSGDAAWLAGVEELCRFASGVDAVVVSLGVDAAELDPESPLRVSSDGYRATGALIAALGVPTVAVHEGGYHLPTLGALTVATLTGLQDRHNS